MAKGTVNILGPRVAKLRDRLHLTQREFGDAAGMSEVRIRKIEKQEAASILPKNFRRLAENLKMKPDELLQEIGPPAFEAGTKLAGAVRQESGDWDRNVDPLTEVKVPEIPLFELSVAAGNWTDVTDVGEVRDPGMIDHGLFRIRLAGDSMTPQYGSGDVVEFRCLRIDREGMLKGKDYYVQKDDGLATFKRLKEIRTEDGEVRELVFVALNGRKYPEPFVVNYAFVTRMARAVAKVEIL